MFPCVLQYEKYHKYSVLSVGNTAKTKLCAKTMYIGSNCDETVLNNTGPEYMMDVIKWPFKQHFHVGNSDSSFRYGNSS